ncbi:MAG: stage V sporulation T C-terminal domain-containing protein [Eubacteriales bacterium]|nr:stage V sporulation T C-terminal domain-containing protein [Eubacteriales bacterium]
MQNTGIVRRIDELGRIVIPKELRRSMRLHVGDELEIAMDGDFMTMKKYSEMEAMRHILEDIALSLREFTEAEVFICDGNFVTLYEGRDKKRAEGQMITDELVKVLRNGSYKLKEGLERIPLYEGDEMAWQSQVISPVINQGDVVGGLVLLTNHNGTSLVGYVNLCVKILSGLCTK